MKRLLIFLITVFPFAGYGQVTDSFSDGDFTNNPIWSGDAAEFIVNASQQLQVNNTVAGASYLSTPLSVSLNNLEWRMFVKQSFAGSSSNFGRVYLVSNQANLEGSLNGFFLQFGEAGSLDAIELFKQTGTLTTSIARGTDAQIANSFAVGIRVTRNASGLWSLYVDATGGTNYVLEASGTEATFTATNFFGVATTYTASNATKFFYDNFIVAPISVDTIPPSVVSASVISSTELDVLFNETVTPTSSQDSTHYNVNNGLGNPLTAIRDAANFSLVHLTFATTFTSGQLDSLIVSNISDIDTNVLVADTITFTYFAPFIASAKDVIINEIYAAPSSSSPLPNVEFVELYNRSTVPINLNQWTFNDPATVLHNIGNYILLPDSFVILCSTSSVAALSAFSNVLGISSFPSLNNSGDHLYLKSDIGTLIDSVNYLDTWYRDAVKAAGGWTLELINPNTAINCSSATNWIASNTPLHGTPNKQNSVFSNILA